MNVLPLNCLACHILARRQQEAQEKKGLLIRKSFRKELLSKSPTSTKVIQPKFTTKAITTKSA